MKSMMYTILKSCRYDNVLVSKYLSKTTNGA